MVGRQRAQPAVALGVLGHRVHEGAAVEALAVEPVRKRGDHAAQPRRGIVRGGEQSGEEAVAPGEALAPEHLVQQRVLRAEVAVQR